MGILKDFREFHGFSSLSCHPSMTIGCCLRLIHALSHATLTVLCNDVYSQFALIMHLNGISFVMLSQASSSFHQFKSLSLQTPELMGAMLQLAAMASAFLAGEDILAPLGLVVECCLV